MGTAGTRKPLVLIVEGNSATSHFIKIFFSSKEFDILTAASIVAAEEYLDSLSGEEFGFALVNIHIGGETAFDLIENIEQVGRHRILVYAYTWDNDPRLVDDAIDAGAHRVPKFNTQGEDSLERIRNYMASDLRLLGHGAVGH